LLVGSIDIPLASGVQPLITRDRINITDVAKTCLARGEGLTIAKDADQFQGRVLDAGWTAPEGTFAWSNGEEARLYLCVKPGVMVVNIDLGAFLPRPDSVQTAGIAVDGKTMTTVKLSRALPRTKLRLALPAADGDRDIEVALHIDSPISPQSVGPSKDTRPLAFSLYGIDAE